jgi:hypothetical protein
MDYTGTAYASQEPCWRCGTALWRLDPPAPGAWQSVLLSRVSAPHDAPRGG